MESDTALILADMNSETFNSFMHAKYGYPGIDGYKPPNGSVSDADLKELKDYADAIGRSDWDSTLANVWIKNLSPFLSKDVVVGPPDVNEGGSVIADLSSPASGTSHVKAHLKCSPVSNKASNSTGTPLSTGMHYLFLFVFPRKPNFFLVRHT